MKPIHLAPELVRCIDAITSFVPSAAGRALCGWDGQSPTPTCEADVETAVAEALAWTEGVRGALRAQGDHFVSDDEVVLFENASHLADQLAEKLATARAGADAWVVADVALALAPLLDRFERGRTRVFFVDLPAVDVLLVAAIACLQGRGSLDAVARRLPGARASHDVLRRRFDASALTVELTAVLETGFHQLADGLDRVQAAVDAADLSALEIALAPVRDGAERVSYFGAWHASRPVPTVRVPVVGAELGVLRDEALSGLEILESAALVLDAALPRLQAFWAEARVAPLVPASEEEVLVASVDEALATLEDALSTGTAVVEAITALEAAFGGLEASALRVDEAADTAVAPAVEAVVGAWYGTIPLLVLDEVAARLSRVETPATVREAAEALRSYLGSGDRESLRGALELLLAAAADVQPISVAAVA